MTTITQKESILIAEEIIYEWSCGNITAKEVHKQLRNKCQMRIVGGLKIHMHYQEAIFINEGRQPLCNIHEIHC